MNNNSRKISDSMRKTINQLLGAEFIPACAVGKELKLEGAELVLKTFEDSNISGSRRLSINGNVLNIISENP